jgi:hypothetical protein
VKTCLELRLRYLSLNPHHATRDPERVCPFDANDVFHEQQPHWLLLLLLLLLLLVLLREKAARRLLMNRAPISGILCISFDSTNAFLVSLTPVQTHLTLAYCNTTNTATCISGACCVLCQGRRLVGFASKQRHCKLDATNNTLRAQLLCVTISYRRS